jgi:hypothetical protein
MADTLTPDFNITRQQLSLVFKEPRTVNDFEALIRMVREGLPILVGTKVDDSRLVSTDGTLTGGGDLTADLTLGIDIPAEAERVRDVIGAALVAGANITITVNDAGDTITIAGAAPYTDEQARDAIGSALVQGTGITITVNDAGDTITIASAPVGSAVSTQTGTSYTAVLGDANTYIRFTNASAVSFTIPPNSSVAFPVNTLIEVEQAGAGALSFVAGTGVTLNSRASDLTLAGQYAVAFAKKVATDTWTVNGDL